MFELVWGRLWFEEHLVEAAGARTTQEGCDIMFPSHVASVHEPW